MRHNIESYRKSLKTMIEESMDRWNIIESRSEDEKRKFIITNFERYYEMGFLRGKSTKHD